MDSTEHSPQSSVSLMRRVSVLECAAYPVSTYLPPPCSVRKCATPQQLAHNLVGVTRPSLDANQVPIPSLDTLPFSVEHLQQPTVSLRTYTVIHSDERLQLRIATSYPFYCCELKRELMVRVKSHSFELLFDL